MSRLQAFVYGAIGRGEDYARGYPLNGRLRALRTAAKWDAEELARYRDRRVAGLVAHAYETVPFYRRRMDDAGLRPSHVASVATLALLPELTRRDLHEHAEDMISSAADRRRLAPGGSSGSTGQPVRYWHDPTALATGYAAERWGWEMAGWRTGDPTTLVWGHPANLEDWKRPGPRAKRLLYRELRICAYTMTDAAKTDAALDEIEAFRPRWIRGYANAIGFLALRARQEGRSLRCAGVLTVAETLQPAHRAVMEEVFGHVCDGYGASEMPGIAHQCPEAGRYHVTDPHVVVEFADEQVSDDGTREVILTNLDEYGMPFIRYRIGDMAIPAEGRCACGRPWSTLAAVRGRRTDVIETPGGGALLAPSFLSTPVFSRFPFILAYQIAKVAYDRIEVRVAGEGPLAPEQLAAVSEALAPYLDGVIGYGVVSRDGFERTAGGKHKLVVDETLGVASPDFAVGT